MVYQTKKHNILGKCLVSKIHVNKYFQYNVLGKAGWEKLMK